MADICPCHMSMTKTKERHINILKWNINSIWPTLSWTTYPWQKQNVCIFIAKTDIFHMKYHTTPIQDGRLCHRQFVHDKTPILGIYLPYLTMTKTKWPPIPGVKHCFHINYHLNPKSKMADFVTDNLSMTNPQYWEFISLIWPWQKQNGRQYQG